MSQSIAKAELPAIPARRGRDRFVAFAFAGAHLLCELDEDGVVAYAAGASCGLADGDAEALHGARFADLVAAEDKPFLRELLERTHRQGRIDPAKVRLCTPGGAEIIALIGMAALPNKPGRIYLSITLPPQLQAAEDSASRHGLLEKDEFSAAATDRLKAAHRMNFDHSLTLLAIDGLARLAREGSPAAVEAARDEISAVLRAASIGGDTAGEIDAGKFGLLHDKDLDIEALQERLQAIVAKHLEDAQAETVRSFSLAFDVGDLDEVDATKALVYSIRKFADEGAEGFRISSLAAGAQSLLHDTKARVAHVRETIERRNFDLVYQPIVVLKSERVHHFEALSRLVGVASPAEFIAFTEQVGMIEDFDLTVCHRVIETLHDKGRLGWRPAIAVNLSARSLSSDLFVTQLQELLTPAEIEPAQMMFELTETHAVADFARINNVLQALRQRGHEFALDDIGGGATSLRSLEELQVDYAKLDGPMIRESAGDARMMQLMKSIISLANGLEVRLIAEQIETRDQADLVRRLGVELAQGFLFGRPALDFQTRYAETSHITMNLRRKGPIWGRWR